MIRRLVVAVALSVLVWSSPAWAENTTCANAEPLIVGSQASDTLPASGEIFFKTALTANRSYVVWVYPPFEDASEGATAVSLTLYRDTACTTVVSSFSGLEYEPLQNITGADVDQISVKPTTTGTHVLRIQNLQANAYTVAVTFVETTTFSPWWFTGGSNQAFVTIRNNMNTSTTATLILYGNTGTVCNTENIVIGANANLYRRVNDYAACVTAAFGSAAISYFGAPGGISANTTVLDAMQGISFDEPFTPRMVWSVLVR